MEYHGYACVCVCVYVHENDEHCQTVMYSKINFVSGTPPVNEAARNVIVNF